METLTQDVILPYLKRHAKRGHQQVTFYLTPSMVTPKNITTDLMDPHEWIYLPKSHSTRSLKREEINEDEDDLPDIQFLLQNDTLDKLQDIIITKSGVKKVVAKQTEVYCRTENEFGLLSSQSHEIIQIDVMII